METRPFGPTAARVPVIGQGTWQMEGGERARAVLALRRGLDLGMTHIDTAEMYGSGEAERIVREAIAGRRDEVFLVSKVLPTNASRAGVIAACERSLANLGTDRLDVYLLHWPSSHPLEGTIAAFEELVRAGKIRSYGVSNFDVDAMEEAVALAGDGKIACNQVLYHLEERDIEHEVLPWCAARRVAVVAYSPFGAGRFPSERSAGGKALASVAAAHGVTPRQVALRFLTRDANVFAIPKASDPAHAADNAGATSFTLTAAEVARIDGAFPRRAKRRSLPTS